MSPEFESSLPGGAGSPAIECDCGRYHFATGCLSPVYENGELEQLRVLAAEKPDRYIESGAVDSIGSYQVFGRTMVYGCPCGNLERVETMLRDGREWIMDFYRKQTEATRAKLALKLQQLDGEKA